MNIDNVTNKNTLFNMELIVAFCKNGVIGSNNKIPWHIPEDLSRFRDITKNEVVIMGRKTFESLPSGPLKNRINIVISRSCNVSNENVIYTSMDQIFPIIDHFVQNGKKIFIIGGNDIYRLFFEYCTVFHITLVDEIVEGDVTFPYDLSYFEKNYTICYNSDVLFSRNKNTKYKYYTFTSNI